MATLRPRAVGPPMRIGIVTQEPILAEGLALLLDSELATNCVSVPSDFVGALTLLADGKVDVLFVDRSEIVPGGEEELTAVLHAHAATGVVLLDSNLRVASDQPVRSHPRLRTVNKSAGFGALIAALREVLASISHGPNTKE